MMKLMERYPALRHIAAGLFILVLFVAFPLLAQTYGILENHIDTAAELDAIVADENIIVETEIDTAAELDAIVADENIIVETEIDAGSELLALFDDETGTGVPVFSIAPSFATNVTLTPASGTAGQAVMTSGVSFTEDGSGTSYIGTVEIVAGAIVHDICFTTTVLWNGTSASLTVGDDDAGNGWFTATDLKATDLVVGEVLCAADDGTWGGVNGVYLTSAGRRGRVTAGVDSGWYYGAASEVIFTVTPGAADGSAGRSFAWVQYSVPTMVASTNS